MKWRTIFLNNKGGVITEYPYEFPVNGSLDGFMYKGKIRKIRKTVTDYANHRMEVYID